MVDTVAALDSVQPRLQCKVTAAIPRRMLGDEASLTACLQNMLMTSMLWLPHQAPVHVHVTTEAAGGAALGAGPHVGLRAAVLPPPSPAVDLTFLVIVETPGRALTAHEVASILAPFSMLPADKVRRAPFIVALAHSARPGDCPGALSGRRHRFGAVCRGRPGARHGR